MIHRENCDENEEREVCGELNGIQATWIEASPNFHI